MTYLPGNPTRTRELITALAVPPPHPLTAAWDSELVRLTVSIKDTVNSNDAVTSNGTTALAYELIYHWRNELDRLLGAFERDDPAGWERNRTPGTWLDALLRLRLVLTHVVSKAYWAAHTEVPYGDIEVERYLWGAR